jgi:FtsH-binding integral membrane protein
LAEQLVARRGGGLDTAATNHDILEAQREFLMADYDNRLMRGAAATGAIGVDAGLRAYMLRVYNYMLVGLLVTGLASLAVYSLSVTTDTTAGAVALPGGLMLTQFGATLFLSPLRWVVIFAPVVLALFVQMRIQHLSVGAALSGFLGYAAMIGASVGTISMFVYTGTSIAQVFFITAAAFGGLSLWGYTTQRDLTGFGSFLIMGAWGLFIAFAVNMFFRSPMVMWVGSVAGVGIFAGLTAYYTQMIKNMYYVGDDGTVAGRKAVLGALVLYISFVNMFMMLLNLMGNRR